MATSYLVPLVPLLQILTQQGVVGSGYKINTYVGGSVSTPLTTYTDSTGTVPNSNPILCDSAGRYPLAWVPAGTLTKIVLTDASNNIIPNGTFDNLPAINDLSALLSTPPAIGGSTPAAGSFTTLSASSTVSGAGFTSFLSSPPGPIGTTAPVGGRFTYAYTSSVAVTIAANAATIDCNLSNVFKVSMTANITTLTIANPHDGQTISARFTQTGGSNTVSWPTSFKWPGASPPLLSTTAGAVDLLTATYYADTGFWNATLLKGMG
jgi:hypothetical protein